VSSLGNNVHIIQDYGVPSDFKEDAGEFTKIGLKYYMIENGNTANWFEALLNCRKLGGNLANIQSDKELKALDNFLYRSRRYWIDLTDLAGESDFRSTTTGKLKDTYPLWDSGEPNNLGKVEHCVHLFYNNWRFAINDYNCNGKYFYICETNYPRTITVVSW